jgi:HK97 family phage major capsid protein
MTDIRKDFLKGLLVPDNTSGAANTVLPKPIADEIIKKIEETNWCRKIFRTIYVPGRTLTIPTANFDYTNVKLAQVGATPPARTELTTAAGSIVLEPGKLVAKGSLAVDDIDDSSLDIIDLLMENFGILFGRAEERAMLLGTERKRDGADDNYLKIFEGLYTIASSKSVHSPVTYSSSTDYAVSDAISEAVKELGVYGRDKNDLVLLVSPDFAHNLRKDRSLANDYMGTGAAIMRGDQPKVWGIDVVETTYLDGSGTACAVLLPKSEAIVGDRRKLKVVPEANPANDAIDYYCYESVDFQLRHKTGDDYDAIILIDESGS